MLRKRIHNWNLDRHNKEPDMLYALRVIQVVNILAATVHTLPEITVYDIYLNRTDQNLDRTAPDSKPFIDETVI